MMEQHFLGREKETWESSELAPETHPELRRFWAVPVPFPSGAGRRLEPPG